MGQICSSYPDCCGGNNYYLDQYVNQTYACTHHYCYPNATQPLNHNCSTNLTGIIFDAPINNDMEKIRLWHEQEMRRIAEEKRLYVEIPLMLSQITGILSIFCSTIVCCIFIGILIYQPMIARRCSLRLSVAVSIMDMIFSYNQAIPANYYNDWRCTAQAASQIWAELLSLFFTSSIALNLLLVFVFELNNTKNIEPYYYAVPLILASVLVAVPLAKDQLGFDRENCFFREPTIDYNNKEKYDQSVNQNTWLFYTGWMCASILWCALVTFLFWSTITRKNMKKQKATSKLGTSSQGEQSTTGTQSTFKNTATANSVTENSVTADKNAKNGTTTGTASSSGNKKSGHSSGSGSGTNKIEKKSQEMIQKAVMRIAFYPVVPLVTALPLALALTVPSISRVWQFGWFSSIMSNLQGFGNACIFYYDPAVSLARETFRKFLTEKYVLKHHPIQDDGQRSKVFVGTGKPTFMYVFARFFSARKKDFIVEGSKKRAITKGSTASNSTAQKPKKASAALDDMDDLDSPSKNSYYQSVSTSGYKPEMYSGATESMMTASIAQTDNFDPAQSNVYQIETGLKTEENAQEEENAREEENLMDEDEDDIEEAEILKEMQQF